MKYIILFFLLNSTLFASQTPLEGEVKFVFPDEAEILMITFDPVGGSALQTKKEVRTYEFNEFGVCAVKEWEDFVIARKSVTGVNRVNVTYSGEGKKVFLTSYATGVRKYYSYCAFSVDRPARRTEGEPLKESWFRTKGYVEHYRKVRPDYNVCSVDFDGVSLPRSGSRTAPRTLVLNTQHFKSGLCIIIDDPSAESVAKDWIRYRELGIPPNGVCWDNLSEINLSADCWPVLDTLPPFGNSVVRPYRKETIGDITLYAYVICTSYTSSDFPVEYRGKSLKQILALKGIPLEGESHEQPWYIKDVAEFVTVNRDEYEHYLEHGVLPEKPIISESFALEKPNHDHYSTFIVPVGYSGMIYLIDDILNPDSEPQLKRRQTYRFSFDSRGVCRVKLPNHIKSSETKNPPRVFDTEGNQLYLRRAPRSYGFEHLEIYSYIVCSNATDFPESFTPDLFEQGLIKQLAKLGEEDLFWQ